MHNVFRASQLYPLVGKSGFWCRSDLVNLTNKILVPLMFEICKKEKKSLRWSLSHLLSVLSFFVSLTHLVWSFFSLIFFSLMPAFHFRPPAFAVLILFLCHLSFFFLIFFFPAGLCMNTLASNYLSLFYCLHRFIPPLPLSCISIDI